MNLRIALDDVQPGAPIAGTVHLDGGGAARGIDAWLEFTEHAPAFRHVAARSEPVRLHEGRAEAGATWRFSLPLPEGALPSLETEWGALRWSVVVRADRALRPDVRAEAGFEVA